MTDWLFYFFAALTVVPALFIAVSRKPVNAAMNMILSLIGLAALLVLLEAYFLAVLLILVYAGAIVVLFLFIIMLIEADPGPSPGAVAWLASAAAFFLMVFTALTLTFGEWAAPFSERGPDAPASLAFAYGVELFTRHLPAFQVTGFLLLIAMIGVIVISRKMESSPEKGGPAQ